MFRRHLAGRRVWNVNSTAAGGGVAEMLRALLGYVNDVGIDVRWVVIGGDARFFAITKRVHNQIHGTVGRGRPLDPDDAAHYAWTQEANAAELADMVAPGDVVLLHDPQTAGLAAPLREAGAWVVWRCHVGLDWENEATRGAWSLLRPHLAATHAYVFSRRRYVPAWIPIDRVWIIPPSLDPFSAKNQPLDDADVGAILATIGVQSDGASAGEGRFVRGDGSAGAVTRSGSVIGDGRPSPRDAVVLQVSRWDRLKDMAGVMTGFADHVVPFDAGYLLLVGPAVAGVGDDPEGADVYAECLARWYDLPAAARERILLVTLPMADVDENGAMVNALQRRAGVIAQKSLAEGFGLTVAEGMWKGRPVIGSAVGGIQDQIVDGTGVLLTDPADLAAFGAAVRSLLDDPATAERIGTAARASVRDRFIGDLNLLRYARLFTALISSGGEPPGHVPA